MKIEIDEEGHILLPIKWYKIAMTTTLIFMAGMISYVIYLGVANWK